jgi:DNA-binding response OmpR family regulator
VVESAAAAGAAAAIGPARLARLEALRAAHPDAFILVYDLVGNEPGTYLEALADDYVAAASMAELAARLRAGLRRLDWQRAPG